VASFRTRLSSVLLLLLALTASIDLIGGVSGA
jgi:hypothetical protein